MIASEFDIERLELLSERIHFWFDQMGDTTTTIFVGDDSPTRYTVSVVVVFYHQRLKFVETWTTSKGMALDPQVKNQSVWYTKGHLAQRLGRIDLKRLDRGLPLASKPLSPPSSE